MKSKQIGKNWVLRFDHSDNFLDELSAWAEMNEIAGASIDGIGSCRQVTLAYYDNEAKEYKERDLRQTLEVVNIHGSVAWISGKVKIHAHATVSDENYQTYGGHVSRMICGATLELNVTPLDNQLNRLHDDKTGLDLLDL